ncbi:hypothetical protein I317_06611 [Kwoniella heveanensis CBS 569]|nr:hypothetical protein I317_06611 [Kwoniella heveanensis CBS 569]
MPEETDTDTKIALLASLLEPISFPFDVLLEVLQESDGDVAKAAEGLLLPRVKSSGKRKAGTSLHDWLTRPASGKAVKREPDQVPSRRPERFMVVDDEDDEAIGQAAGPSRPSEPAIDLLSKLRQAPGNPAVLPKPKAGPQPPVILSSQAAIDSHSLPLTILNSPLPASLASALYLAMTEESESWERNKFYLAGKWVESPHTTTVYQRLGGGYGGHTGARYFYSGTELDEPKQYIPLLARAADLVERAVNKSLIGRRRYPLEWAGEWRANVCGANRYDGAKSTVGWHADQLTYLGPYTTIASLSLGTPRAFRLRQTDPVDSAFATTSKPTRTYEVNLGHNSLCLMNAGCQERYKHTVPPQKALDLFRPTYGMDEEPIPLYKQETYTSRINITFRFYREDFHPVPGAGPSGPREGTPVCKCGIPTLLRADQKAKARVRLMPPSPSKSKPKPKSKPPQEPVPAAASGFDIDTAAPKSHASKGLIEDDMLFFWQCQSPGQTGDLKGCGFFRILDMKKEGRGPCIADG